MAGPRPSRRRSAYAATAPGFCAEEAGTSVMARRPEGPATKAAVAGGRAGQGSCRRRPELPGPPGGGRPDREDRCDDEQRRVRVGLGRRSGPRWCGALGRGADRPPAARPEFHFDAGPDEPLAERLPGSFTTVVVDWPGFGDRPRPRVGWRPEAYASFLAHFQDHVVRAPLRATIAAGHAAGYALTRAATLPGSLGRLCLVAPTWRGPLPTMLGKRPPALRLLAGSSTGPCSGRSSTSSTSTGRWCV